MLLFVQRELDSTCRSASNGCTCRYSLLQIKAFVTLIYCGVLRSMFIHLVCSVLI